MYEGGKIDVNDVDGWGALFSIGSLFSWGLSGSLTRVYPGVEFEQF